MTITIRKNSTYSILLQDIENITTSWQNIISKIRLKFIENASRKGSTDESKREVEKMATQIKEILLKNALDIIPRFNGSNITY